VPEALRSLARFFASFAVRDGVGRFRRFAGVGWFRRSVGTQDGDGRGDAEEQNDDHEKDVGDALQMEQGGEAEGQQGGNDHDSGDEQVNEQMVPR